MSAAPDPDFPRGFDYVTSAPDELELRDLRRIVTERLGGIVYVDRHADRKTPIKQAPGKFRRVLVELTNCERDHVLCDIPTNENEHDPNARNMRICLVCDAGRELLGYTK